MVDRAVASLPNVLADDLRPRFKQALLAGLGVT